jgi:phosphoribosyl-ATP pyrophosphohydrolase
MRPACRFACHAVAPEGNAVMAKSAKIKDPAASGAAKSKRKKQIKPKKLRKPAKLRNAAKPAAARAEVAEVPRPLPPLAIGPAAAVLDRLWSVVTSRRTANPAVSHSARLLSRGTAKVAQKFGEESVECLIEAVAGNRDAVVAESADVLYHLIVLWVACGIRPEEVWEELKRREGISGIAEKAARARNLPIAFGLETTKIP